MSDNSIKKEVGFKIKKPAGRQEVITTQLFGAPRDLVFRAYNDPNLRGSWWGPKDLKTMVDKMDVRPGGSWRIVQRDAAGEEYGFHGVYHTVKEPEMLAFTFEYDGAPGHVSLESLNFEELPGGKTRMTDTVVFQSIEDRDEMYKSGMEDGIAESYTRFTDVLEKLCSEERIACAA